MMIAIGIVASSEDTPADTKAATHATIPPARAGDESMKLLPGEESFDENQLFSPVTITILVAGTILLIAGGIQCHWDVLVRWNKSSSIIDRVCKLQNHVSRPLINLYSLMQIIAGCW